ncbi:MAG: peptidylprolyl isomerase [Nitrospirae bacterium]|nr:peptidylprolyl isomerase [Nitrospirota bacterium]
MFKLSSKIVFFIFIILISGTSIRIFAEEQEETRVVAEVNGTPIRFPAFQEELKKSKSSLGHGEFSPERLDEIKRDVLDHLIGKELVVQEAKKRNLTPDELIRKEVYEKSLYSEEDARIYYREHPLDFMSPEGVRLRHLLVRVDPSSSNEGWKAGYQNALELSLRAKQGERFEALVEKFSDPESRYFGGDLKVQFQGKMAMAEFEKEAFSLNVGEVSAPIQTLYGFSLIQIVEKVPPKPYLWEEINPELLKKRLIQEKEARRSEEWIRELRSQAIIKIEQK